MSKTAKSGFRNEDFIKESIQNRTKLGMEILNHMKISDFTNVLVGREIGESQGKSDVIVFTDKEIHGISIKRVNGNYNQVDKRKVDNYLKLWKMDNTTITGLKKFCGEIIPNKKTRDSRRYFMDELSDNEHNSIMTFFKKNKDKVLSDIFAGRGEYAAKWLLVVQYIDEKVSQYKIISIDKAIENFGEGEIILTKRKSIQIGKVVLQRKGGNGGGPTARLLQFKIRPRDIL